MKGLQHGRDCLKLWGKLYLYFYFDSFHENIPKWITRRILACLFFSWKLFLITGCLWTMYMTMFPIAVKIKINYSSVWKVFLLYHQSQRIFFKAWRIQYWEFCCYSTFFVSLDFFFSRMFRISFHSFLAFTDVTDKSPFNLIFSLVLCKKKIYLRFFHCVFD